MDEKLFEKAYLEIYNIWEQENQDSENRYRKRTWIFPNHIDLLIENCKKLALKYGAEIEICVYSALLHDIGLVYKREKNSSPQGHEERSLEFAKEFLKKYNFNDEKIKIILECIKSSEAGHIPNSIEEKVLATSDFIAQFNSIHYFAKAVFESDIEKFVNWFKKRIEINFEQKIHFEEIKTELMPVRNHYREIIILYEKTNLNN